ncbi:BglG family transcription antiterminator [Halobacillus sp. A5]|uniref:BglG family transcription antiterminator n=1 Tax=Halobacillus sp. A5 TaxID=2880263 RepID=UPI0020A66370|nr:BglG family transcription antiterminator [Halobacillus sp. A5]MCP3027935.1 BglG family transcription antiterminator [Halobacillus sp. A5]
MNERQTELLRKLIVQTNDVFHVNELAGELGCSEKTLRNDLKAVEGFLQSGARIVRKPGVGVYLKAGAEEKSRLFQYLNQSESKSDKDRILELAYRLLTEEKALTLTQMAEQHYSSVPTIKKDLDLIHRWLGTFELELVTRQRVGSSIEGRELDKRNALAHLPELVSSAGISSDYVLHLFPAYEVDVFKQALKRMQTIFEVDFTEAELESLLIHALVMMKRTKQQSAIKVRASDKRAVEGSLEYKMTDWLFTRIGETLRLTFPVEEKIYFTWHVASCKREGYPSRPVNDGLLKEVTEQLTFQLQIMTMMNFRNDELLGDGLRIHLDSTIHRVRHGLMIRNPMLQDIKKMYPYMFSMVVLALEEVNNKHDLNIPEDEAAYLVLHFQAAVERLEKKRDTSKRVLIVCELGIGMSHLLQAKLEQAYQGLKIIACVAEREVEEMVKEHPVDGVISTKPLGLSHPPSIVISPLLESKDKQKVDQFLEKVDRRSLPLSSNETLVPYLQEEFTYLQVRAEHPYQVIEMLANKLKEAGKVTESFAHRALLRERSSFTSIGGGIAIPHAHPEEVHESTVALAVLDESIEWGKERTSVVFLLAVSQKDQALTRPLMNAISKLSEDYRCVEKLKSASNFQEIITVLT